MSYNCVGKYRLHNETMTRATKVWELTVVSVKNYKCWTNEKAWEKLQAFESR